MIEGIVHPKLKIQELFRNYSGFITHNNTHMDGKHHNFIEKQQSILLQKIGTHLIVLPHCVKRLTSDLEGVLLMSRGYACALWVHVSCGKFSILFKILAILSLLPLLLPF